MKGFFFVFFSYLVHHYIYKNWHEIQWWGSSKMDKMGILKFLQKEIWNLRIKKKYKNQDVSTS